MKHSPTTHYSLHTTYFFLFILLLSTFHFLLPVAPAQAARIYFSPEAGEFSSEAALPVSVFLDTEGEEINAVEAEVEFSPDVFSARGVSDGNSIISFWVNRPKISPGLVSFSGIIPGGYNGRSGLLLKIFLVPEKSGEADVAFGENSAAMLNDGKGTKTELELSGAKYRINKFGSVFLEPEDNAPPEDFRPQIGQDLDFSQGKYFLVFSTQDKGSGIERYEVKEGKGPYKIAESGYVLENQKLNEKIMVKAVDKSGNWREAALPPVNRFLWYQELLILVIIILICALASRFLSKTRS